MSGRRPHLAPLDRHVLTAVPREGRGRRARDILEDLDRPYRYSSWKPTLADVRGVLRGLEVLDLVTERGGWWRRAAP